MIYVATHADDEVTSVVDTMARDAAGDGQDGADDQVTHTSVRSDPSAPPHRDVHDPNTAANDDQDDRVRIMARGSRDAILRARERHVQRRAPARPTIEPEPSDSDTSGDHVIESRDRQHYDPPTDRTALPSSGGAGTGLENTPPVPREEVQGKGPGLSPAVGPDARFDSVPDVKADIELPRLRQFLHGSQGQSPSEPPTPTQLPDVSVSSYDLVLRRAREIKASTTGEPQPPRPAPSRQEPPPQVRERRIEAARPQPAMSTQPTPQVPPQTPTVVWDLDPDDIRIAFQRVREAIDQPLPRRPAPPGGRVNADGIPPVAEEHLPDSATFEDDEAPSNDEWDLENLDEEDSASSYFRRPEPESPRGSWWRSLNFGIRRRVTAYAPPGLPYGFEPDDDDGTPAYATGDFVYDDEMLEPADAAAETWEAFDDPSFAVDDDDQDLAAGYDAYAASVERQEIDAPYLATSEESWLEDELEFPEPQPAEWHETRATLLAHRPEPQDDMVPSPVPVPRQPAIDPGHATEPVSASLPDPTPQRQPPPYFAIDQPGGMNAFRAALFGAADTGGEDPEDDLPLPVQSSTATSSPAESGPDRAWLPRSPGESRVEASSSSPSWWQHSGPASPASRFERGSSLDIPDEILERDDVTRTFDVASRVPKCCRTCRSFRPSDHRDQGWCMNRDAFTHRQMVNADTLSCRSSIGDWWLAADQSWIPPEDVIRPETPRTDRLMERQDSQNEPSDQDGRRVRTRRAV